jgi:hypothetical protein
LQQLIGTGGGVNSDARTATKQPRFARRDRDMRSETL